MKGAVDDGALFAFDHLGSSAWAMPPGSGTRSSEKAVSHKNKKGAADKAAPS
jgi:hypothetical protein